MDAIFEEYNREAASNNWVHLKYIHFEEWVIIGNCTIVGFLDQSYGKYSSEYKDFVYFMEYGPFMDFMMEYMPSKYTNGTNLTEFVATNPQLLFSYADYLYYDLPSPRYEYYQEQNFNTMKSRITREVAALVEDLGYYSVVPQLPLLIAMEELTLAVVMLGCVFNVVLILMAAIATLLVYSLLMVSVEQKTFNNGVLRMIGVTRTDCILVVVCSTLTFVIPSLVLSYVGAMVANHFLLTAIYPPDMSA